MFTHTTSQHGTDSLVKWLLILLLAGALACVLARPALGGPPRTPAERSATPIPAFEDPAAEPNPMAWNQPAEWGDDWERAVTLWRIVDLHGAGRHVEAGRLWQGVALPPATMVWKDIGQGMAAMHDAQWDQAAALLERATEAARDNPVAPYVLALTKIRQAAAARVFFDDAGPNADRLVNAVPTRGELLAAAQTHLLQAVDRAPLRNPDDSLLAIRWVTPAEHSMEMPLAVPAVIDLVESWGVADLEADAHWRLGALYLDQGELAAAEEHWDRASEFGRDLRNRVPCARQAL